MSYAELSVTSNFTFLTGASHAFEYALAAKDKGLAALALTDTNTFAGIVRAHTACKVLDLPYIVGVRLQFTNCPDILAYPKTRLAYGRLCRLLTTGKRRTKKGECELRLADLLEWGEGSILIIAGEDGVLNAVHQLKARFEGHIYLGLTPRYDGYDTRHFEARTALGEELGLPLIALGEPVMHHGSRRRLADILSCIREGVTIDKIGRLAQPNSERRIKSEFEMRRLFTAYPDAIANTAEIAEQCTFSLNELKYDYPDEVLDGEQPDDRLRRLTEEGLKWRYPDGVPLRIQLMVEKELALIAQLDYARYFLTVHDLVQCARSKGILCQGRGSAANSVTCYALGITEASPETIAMVFERFISEVRNEPPDIDVDFEHERREEVIQYIYEKFGRHRAAICSTVVHFRTKGAIREVGKAMGLSEDAVAALSSQVWGWSSREISEERVNSAGLSLQDDRMAQTLELTQQLIGFPRHLSQHTGGFVVTQTRLDEMCPIDNAAMADRTYIEWDKDDIDAVGMLKIDVLALGMLTTLRKAFEMLSEWKGEHYTLATLPQDDLATYKMICEGKTLGVFQIESRAQMQFLPRMRPQCFYDLVIEVAIIRPGPIQGDMVHPYLKRRRGEEPVVYPSKDLEPVLGKTLGIPLFQEQAMQIAVVAAGFSPSEADQLRRALGTAKGPGTVQKFKDRFITGCIEKGYDQDFAEAVFRQLEGFSGYGFPESHAASFALLVYASCWLKCHHPEIFACALLNSQPMGFYAPAQIVGEVRKAVMLDARQQGVEVRPICAENSYWDHVLEPNGSGKLAIRLGFRQIKGFKEQDGLWLTTRRGNGYRSIDTAWRRGKIGKKALIKLAEADAFAAYDLNRRDAVWEVNGLPGERPLPLFENLGEGLPEVETKLPKLTIREEVFEDYVSTRLTLREHPVSLLQAEIGKTTLADELRDTPDKSWVEVCGVVITRQRPGTAKKVTFVTLEDHTGHSNIVIWNDMFERNRKSVMTGRLLKIYGKVEREGIVTNVITQRIIDLSYLLDTLGDAESAGAKIEPSHDNADEAKRPIPVKEQVRTGERLPSNPLAREKKKRRDISSFYGAGARHPRQQANKLFKSRDFH